MIENKANIQIPKFSDVLLVPSNPEDLFTLLYPVGTGGFGTVYKAMHNSSKQIFAIKIIDFTKGCNNDKNNISFNYKSIIQETSIMRLINESNYIIKYYGSYYSHRSNTIWLILEYCSCGSAVDLMLSMERTLSEVEVSTIMKMVLKGLIHMHKLNLIHRDIKGANILLSEDGYAKLGDFGVGIQMSDEEYRTSKKGSPYWMSPQVILKKNYDMKTDIWSLGITCLELVEGQPPYSNLSPQEVLEKIAVKPPKAKDIINEMEHTSNFINFVNLCLEIDPKKRPSADVLIKHPFIKELAKGEDYLKKLIKANIDKVENWRLDKIQMNQYQNENKDNQENEINLNYSESLLNSNSNKKQTSNGFVDNENNIIDNGIEKNGLNDIKEEIKYNSNAAYKSMNCEDFNNDLNNIKINEDFDDNKYVIINKDKEVKNLSPNKFINDNSSQENKIYSPSNNQNYLIKNNYSLSNNNSNINDRNDNIVNKNISVLSENNIQSSNISDYYEYTFKKQLKENNFEINDKNNINEFQSKINIINNNKKSGEIYYNGNKKNIGGFSKKKVNIYNNTNNSNGGNIDINGDDMENIDEPDDDEEIRPIKHCIFNANCENNKLDKTYDNIRINMNIESNTAENKSVKKHIKIPPLNLVGIFDNNNIISTDLNTHDSPTNTSSFSLYKIHEKYFK